MNNTGEEVFWVSSWESFALFSTDNCFETSMSISLLLQKLPLFTRLRSTQGWECIYVNDSLLRMCLQSLQWYWITRTLLLHPGCATLVKGWCCPSNHASIDVFLNSISHALSHAIPCVILVKGGCCPSNHANIDVFLNAITRVLSHAIPCVVLVKGGCCTLCRVLFVCGLYNTTVSVLCCICEKGPLSTLHLRFSRSDTGLKGDAMCIPWRLACILDLSCLSFIST